MSLEERIEELTEAVVALTVALNSGAAAEPEPEEEPEPEPPKKAAAPKKKAAPKRGVKKPAGPTLATVHDKLREVQESLGKEAVKEILEEFEVKKASDLEEEDYKEFIEVCDTTLDEAEDED